MSDTSDAKPFLGGIPYALDIKKLNETYPLPSLDLNRLISHEELAAVIGERVGSQRYYGVINAWKRLLRNEHAVHVLWEKKEGVRVVDQHRLHKHTRLHFIQKGKQTVRAANDFRWIDRSALAPEEQKVYDHDLISAAKVKAAASQEARSMALELAPIKCLPRPIRKVS